MEAHKMTFTPYAAYEKQAQYQTTVAPLIEALNAECARLGLPMLCVVNFALERDGAHQMALSNHFNGVESVPAEMMAAVAMIKGDAQEAFNALKYDAVRRSLADNKNQAVALEG